MSFSEFCYPSFVSLICSFSEIILLDEPTSGLDSHTARYIVSNLRDMAHNMNKMVLLTIHQPGSDIFGLLDQIGILSNGEAVYFGGAAEMVPYFAQIGFPCSTYTNPLDRYGRNITEPEHSISYKTTCAPSEDSDQPVHPHSPVRIFARHSVGNQ